MTSFRVHWCCSFWELSLNNPHALPRVEWHVTVSDDTTVAAEVYESVLNFLQLFCLAVCKYVVDEMQFRAVLCPALWSQQPVPTLCYSKLSRTAVVLTGVPQNTCCMHCGSAIPNCSVLSPATKGLDKTKYALLSCLVFFFLFFVCNFSLAAHELHEGVGHKISLKAKLKST